MPSWPIHFKIADQLAHNFNISDYDSYLYGSVLPDIPKRMEIPKKTTHFYNRIYKTNGANEDIVDIEKFENEYADEMNNPLILGYYIHLLTDYYFNRYVNFNKWIDKDNAIGYYGNDGKEVYVTEHKERVHAKQHDSELYGKKLYAMGVHVPQNADIVVENIKSIKDYVIPENEVRDRITYLNNGFKERQIIEDGEHYNMFTDDELNKVFSNCLLFIETRMYEKHFIDGKEMKR